MSESLTKRATRRWRLGVLLPLGAVLSGIAVAAEAPSAEGAGEEIVLKDVKVKAARDKKTNAYKADTASTGKIGHKPNLGMQRFGLAKYKR